MSEFPWVQLRYVARTGTGHTPSRTRPELWKEEQRTIPWVTLADVGRLRDGAIDVISETSESISPAGVAASSAVVHPTGTVILSRTASVGFAGIMGLPMAVSQDYMTWTPGPRLSGRFLLHFLRGSRAQMLGLMHGSTHKTIYMPDLHALRVPLPPIEVQTRVADLLDQECARIGALLMEFGALKASLNESALEDVGRELAQYPRAPLRFRLAGIDQGWSPECESQLAAPGEWGGTQSRLCELRTIQARAAQAPTRRLDSANGGGGSTWRCADVAGEHAHTGWKCSDRRRHLRPATHAERQALSPTPHPRC